jgi:hypothetical protein
MNNYLSGFIGYHLSLARISLALILYRGVTEFDLTSNHILSDYLRFQNTKEDDLLNVHPSFWSARMLICIIFQCDSGINCFFTVDESFVVLLVIPKSVDQSINFDYKI